MNELLLSVSGEYWIKKLSAVKPLSLFYGRPPASRLPEERKQRLLPVPEKVMGQVIKVSNGEAPGIYVILMSVLQTLLWKYTGENGFLVAVGNFADNNNGDQPRPCLFFKTTADQQVTPRQLLKQSLDELNDIVRHQHIETSYLEDKFGLSEDRKLFDQLGLLYPPFNTFGDETPAADLLISLEQGDAGHMLVLSYCSAVYEEEQVQQLGRHFILLLSSLLENPDKPLGTISLLSAAEIQAVLSSEAYNSAYQADELLVSLLEAAAAKFAGQDALITDQGKLNYTALNEAANRLAHHLRSAFGIKPNDVIGVMMGRTEQLVIVILAILKSGAAFLPLDPSSPDSRKSYMLADAAAALLINGPGMPSAAGYYDGKVADATQLLQESMVCSPADPIHVHTPNDLAYIIYTSGSTGKPKGVAISHNSIAHYLTWANEYYFGNGQGSRFALFTSLTFDLTLTSLFSGLLRGDGLFVAPEEPVEDTLRKLFTGMHGVNAVKLTPSHVNLLRELNLTTTPVSVAIIGGEALYPGHVAILKALNPQMRIYNEYGPTESTVGCMVKEVGGGDQVITIGKAIARTGIYVLDKHNCIAPVGVAGELGITGAGLALGYVNQPALTAGRFVELSLGDAHFRLYKTGDLAVLQPDGEYQYLGRKDRQLKVRAFRIEPEEIELCIRAFPGVTDAVVLAGGEDEQDKVLVAYYTTGIAVIPDVLREHLQLHLPGYMVPGRLIAVDHFPLTAHGKIDQQALLQLDQYQSLRKNYQMPRNELEAMLAGVWEQVLGITSISMDDQFLHLKGDSIRAIRICNRVRKATGDVVPITALFEAGTIERLAAYISNARDQPSAAGHEAITSSPEAAYYELSHAQERIWTTAQIEENKISYNICMNKVLEGVDPGLLIRALQQLLLRHDSLRTVFTNVDGHTRQRVLQGTEWFGVAQVDLRGTPDAAQKVQELYNRETVTPLDVETRPPIRCSLLQLENDTCVLLFTLHHIIADAWTMDVLYRDMQAIYASLATYGENRVPPLKLQYKDFVAWEKKQLTGENLLLHKNYWLSVFQPPIPQLQMSTDFPRPAVMTYHGVSTVLHIDAGLRDKLKVVGGNHNASLFMLLLAALNTLLYRYTGQQDLIIGSPFAGRNYPELEDQAGIYINLFAFRTRITAGERWEQLLEKIKHTVLEAYGHHIYPFDFIIKDLKIERDPARAPLFDVIFSLQNIGLDAVDLTDEAVYGDMQDVFTENSKFDLNFIISEHEKGMICFIKYNKDLFRKETIEVFKRRFVTVLESIALNPSITLEDIVLSDLSTGDERTAGDIRNRFNIKF